MKKVIALLLSVVMVFSLTGCKLITGKIKEEIKDTIGDALSDATGGLSDALGGDLSGALNGIGDNLSDATGNAADSVLSAAGVRHDANYWCEKFGTNHCPFSISALGISFDYYFRDGGRPDFWVFTEENTGGWYVYDGYIISDNGAFAINIADADYFSSCCTYEAKVYTGEKLERGSREAIYTTGVFHTLNSYTAVPTNWGVQFYSDSSQGVFDQDAWTVYDMNSILDNQEWFDFYIGNVSDNYTEQVKLWALEHRDYKEYPEILDDEILKTGLQIGTFTYSEEDHNTVCRAYIPNSEANGFDTGYVDLLITCGNDENVVVGVLTVALDVGGKG